MSRELKVSGLLERQCGKCYELGPKLNQAYKIGFVSSP